MGKRSKAQDLGLLSFVAIICSDASYGIHGHVTFFISLGCGDDYLNYWTEIKFSPLCSN